MKINKLAYTPPSRLKSWINIEQIEKDAVPFLNKIGDILFSENYNESAIKYTRSILEFLLDWEFVTWKQFDSLMCIRKKNERSPVIMTKDKNKNGFYYINIGNNYVNVKSKNLSFTCFDKNLSTQIKSAKTDKDFDTLYKNIFGHEPLFKETSEDGFELAYDKNGERYFALPSSDIQLHNYI